MDDGIRTLAGDVVSGTAPVPFAAAVD